MSNIWIFTLGFVIGEVLLGGAIIIILVITKRLRTPKPQGWENKISDMLENPLPKPLTNIGVGEGDDNFFRVYEESLN